MFLAVDLLDLRKAIDARTPAQIDFAWPDKVDWFGGPDAETALLAAMAWGDEASELPCLTGTGTIRACGINDAGAYALAEVDGRPVLLDWMGFGHAAGRTMLVFEKANAAAAERWPTAKPGKPPMVFRRGDIPGRWCLETLEGNRPLIFDAGGRVLSPDGAEGDAGSGAALASSFSGSRA